LNGAWKSYTVEPFAALMLRGVHLWRQRHLYWPVAGFADIQNNPFPDDKLLMGLAVLGALPVLASFVFDGKGSAVLLPLIDSANHLAEADSTIEYNPLSKAFELSVGPKCLVKDGEQTQLFISYGDKADAELLLNYGFIPDVPCSDGTDEAARAKQRTTLANTFLKRNQ